MGWDADEKLLKQADASAEHLDTGCCGLAGNFGFQPGHAGVSEACAERVLLPRMREAPAEAVVLADGFSCRTQIHELDSGGREAMHLSELLAAGGSLPAEYAERRSAPRPAPPPAGVKAITLAAAAGAAALAAAAAIRRRRR